MKTLLSFKCFGTSIFLRKSGKSYIIIRRYIDSCNCIDDVESFNIYSSAKIRFFSLLNSLLDDYCLTYYVLKSNLEL